MEAHSEELGLGRLGRRELLAMVSAIMALMALAIDLMLPAFGDIEEAFNLGEGTASTEQVITVFFFGLALAQLVYGPLADAFGRKVVLYLSIGVYLVGAVISALAPTFTLLLIGRFIWGVGAAGARVVAVAIIRDRFAGAKMAKAMSQMMAIFVIVPVIAPTLGAGVLIFAPWRALFWLCGGFASVIAVWSLRLDETLEPANVRPLALGNTLTAYRQVARTPLTFGYTMSSLFQQGVFTTYLAVSPKVVGDNVFGYEDQFPFIFGAIAILFGLAAVINGRIVERLGIDGVVNRTFAFLGPAVVLLMVIGIVGDGRPPIWLYMPVLGLILASFMFLMPNLGSASMEPLGELAGSASALTGAVRVAGGAALATVVSPLMQDSATDLAIGVAIMCALSGICVWLVRRGADRRLLTQPVVTEVASV